MGWFRSFWQDESGQGLAEYTVLIALITLAVVLMIAPFREAIVAVFASVADVLSGI
jgi:Flp pilus assembly pilin Flp